MAREINLVPDIKDEMIKTLKLRNLILFISLVVAVASFGATAIAGIIAGGQQLAIEGKRSTIDNLSNKLNSYSDLSDLLTIKDQLSNISTLTNRKTVLSRTFNILSALIPTGPDTITISELTVNLSTDQPALTFDAQADAKKEPYIDYNVLDSFKKSMQYMRYDYGEYVTREGDTIPAYCMIETGSDGAILRDVSRGIYAYWTIDAEGCNSTNSKDYSTEEYEGQKVVKIWRTPQYSEWYSSNPKEDAPQISLDGKISNVAHFESNCIGIVGDNSQDASNPKWTESNDMCLLIPDGINGINITDSSNGRSSSDDLVLRFSAIISLSPEAYRFSNHHLIAIAPAGRYNVTDSYVQIQAMFGEPATECATDDAECRSANNTNGGNNG